MYTDQQKKRENEEQFDFNQIFKSDVQQKYPGQLNQIWRTISWTYERSNLKIKWILWVILGAARDQYLVWPPRASMTAWQRRRIEWISRLTAALGMLAQAWRTAASSCAAVVGLGRTLFSSL